MHLVPSQSVDVSIASCHHFTLPHRCAGAVSKHAAGNVHGLQLLEQELGCVWDVNLSNLGLVLARPAFKRLVGQVPIVLLLVISRNMHDWTTYAMGVIRPQISQTWTLNASDTSNNRSFKKAAAP